MKQIDAEITTEFPGLGFVKKAALETLELKDGTKQLALITYSVINNEDYMRLAKMITVSRHYDRGIPYVSKGITLPVQFHKSTDDNDPTPSTAVITPDTVYRRFWC